MKIQITIACCMIVSVVGCGEQKKELPAAKEDTQQVNIQQLVCDFDSNTATFENRQAIQIKRNLKSEFIGTISVTGDCEYPISLLLQIKKGDVNYQTKTLKIAQDQVDYKIDVGSIPPGQYQLSFKFGDRFASEKIKLVCRN